MHSLNNENLNNELKNYILGDQKHPDERTHTCTLQNSHAMIQAQIQKKYNIELTDKVEHKLEGFTGEKNQSMFVSGENKRSKRQDRLGK